MNPSQRHVRRTVPVSLRVLDLFPNPVDSTLDLDDLAADFGVAGLAGDGVGLAEMTSSLDH